MNPHSDTSGPVTQAWATPLSIPSTVDSTTQDSISDITREDYDHVESDNAHLSHEVQELCQQMAHLLSQQQHNKPNPESINTKRDHSTTNQKEQMVYNQYHRIPLVWVSHGQEL